MQEPNYTKITEQWVRTVVVELNLCPFAAEPLSQGRIRYVVCEESEPEAIYRALLLEMEGMLSLPEAEVETSLLVVPQGLASFESYLSLLYSAEEAVLEVGLEGILQLASFHPDYCFEGVAQNDPANYTNRSPFPMFHLIREASLERALSSYPNPELIPQRNIEKLRSLGLTEIQRRLHLCG
ncbi:MAG: DUF1415 domain-containing protein [Pseudomonadota bacterium]